MKPVEIKKNLYWVGAVDWSVRDFHGYSTLKGSTYNAYLLVDEKVVLFDAVKKEFRNELLHRIHNVIDPKKIDYIVVNHVEMDHSGCLPEMIELIKPEKVFCSVKGKETLLAHYHRDDWPFHPVKSGDSISFGARSAQFLETRMLHWPDSMFSYIKEEKLLISSDAFGQHWATSERFNDEVDGAELFKHAAKYYANILLPFSKLVQKLVEDVGNMGLQFDMIAPDHGLIWRKDPLQIVEAYKNWSEQKPKRKALVIFDTMWHSTEKMAKAIYDGLLEEGVSAQMLDLKANHRSDIITEALDAKALVFGSSTLNNNMLPRMADLLTYMKGLKPKDKIGAAFGSYGWSGEAAKLINAAMEDMKFEIVDPGVRVSYVPDHDALKPCVELGRKIGKIIKEKIPS